MKVFEITEADGPVILGQPHGGTHVPEDIFARLNQRGRGLDDTDWHITRLYHGLLPAATVVRANFHRYVIDANRDPAGVSLYPGQNTTSLCPVTDFDGHDIWQSGQAPSTDEILTRRETYHAPYHAALAEQIARAKAKHGVAILFECHSIRSEISFLFDAVLPDFNIGTNMGETCAQIVETATLGICEQATGYLSVLNGRFRGGWTTRRYGRPDQGVHAIQLELAQRGYMDEAAPWTYRRDRAAPLRAVLGRILNTLDEHARSGALQS
jgi:N-formylglutamate deformylase